MVSKPGPEILMETAEDVINRIWKDDQFVKSAIKIDEDCNEAYLISISPEHRDSMKIDYSSIDAVSKAIIGEIKNEVTWMIKGIPEFRKWNQGS